MQLGLVGLPQSGKTTLFQLLTEARGNGVYGARIEKAVVRVPDRRVDFLARLYQPRKTTYAQLEVIDIPGLVPGSEKEASVFLQSVRDTDALVHVVRAFADDNVPHLEGSIDPLRDLELIEYELLLADLDLVEKRIDRIKQGKKRNEAELNWLQRVKKMLEEETPISNITFSSEEQAWLRTYQFLTAKPILVALNLDEASFQDGIYPHKQEILDYVGRRGIPLVLISAKLESEIAELEGEERELFMRDMGISEPGIVRLAQAAYRLLGLISFFTVGEDEVKAWTIVQGTPARKAAGKIHSDIERGFIRAEVVKYEDLEACGTMARVREKGLFRLEGKDYLVQDGDIIHFRFNV